MKKLAALLLTLFSCAITYALPIGNPGEASLFSCGLWRKKVSPYCNPYDSNFRWCDAISFRSGFYGDYIFDRHLEINRGGDFEKARIFTNASTIVLNFGNRIDAFATFGVTNFYTKQNASVFGAPVSFESELFFKPSFSWSIGGRATLFQFKCLVLGLEGQYFSFRPKIDHFINYSSGSKTYFDNVYASFYEWQIGLGAAYRIATRCPTVALIPFLGIKYAHAHLDINNISFITQIGSGAITPTFSTLNFADARTKKHWGYSVGMSLTLSDLVGVTLEGRFADEKGVSIKGQVRF